MGLAQGNPAMFITVDDNKDIHMLHLSEKNNI
jgi:hypothetical protein